MVASFPLPIAVNNITLPKDTYSAEIIDKTWMHARTPHGHAQMKGMRKGSCMQRRWAGPS